MCTQCWSLVAMCRHYNLVCGLVLTSGYVWELHLFSWPWSLGFSDTWPVNISRINICMNGWADASLVAKDISGLMHAIICYNASIQAFNPRHHAPWKLCWNKCRHFSSHSTNLHTTYIHTYNLYKSHELHSHKISIQSLHKQKKGNNNHTSLHSPRNARLQFDSDNNFFSYK